MGARIKMLAVFTRDFLLPMKAAESADIEAQVPAEKRLSIRYTLLALLERPPHHNQTPSSSANALNTLWRAAL
jgi:hypothetical protein